MHSPSDKLPWFVFAVLIALLLALFACGCSTFQPTPKPMTGGTAVATLPFIPPVVGLPGVQTSQAHTNWPVRIEIAQGENQETPTVQSYTRTVAPDGASTEEFRSELGVNQHDQARDQWASVKMFKDKLKSYNGIKLFGFALILAALAMFHPAVAAVTGRTGQIATGSVGLLCVFLSQTLAGNETLVIVLGTIGVAVYLFARRHGVLQGMVDANKNGIPDDQEP